MYKMQAKYNAIGFLGRKYLNFFILHKFRKSSIKFFFENVEI